MIGFPFVTDQYYNAQRMEHKGFGATVDVWTFTPEDLVHNVRRIIADRSCKDRVMKAAQIFRANLQSPAERVAYWIEHVCRFGGGHLRSAGQDLPLYAYLTFDVFALVLLVIGIVAFIVWKLFNCAVKRCLRKPREALRRKGKHN